MPKPMPVKTGKKKIPSISRIKEAENLRTARLMLNDAPLGARYKVENVIYVQTMSGVMRLSYAKQHHPHTR